MNRDTIARFDAGNEEYAKLVDQIIEAYETDLMSLRKLRAHLIEMGASKPQIQQIAERFSGRGKIAG